MHLIKLSFDGALLYRNSYFSVDFFAEDRISIDSTENAVAGLHKTHDSGRVYTQNVIAFAGINASGKTTTLAFVEFALSFLAGETINRAWSGGSMPLSMFAGDHLTMRALFWHSNSYYLLESVMAATGFELEDFNASGECRYRIESEKIWRYPSGAIAKNVAGDFGRFKQLAKLWMERVETEEGRRITSDDDNLDSIFLRDDESIVSAITTGSKLGSRSSSRSMRLRRTLPVGERLRRPLSAAVEVVTAFDSSIETLVWDSSADVYRIKFVSRPEQAFGRNALERILSKGTIVGSELVDQAVAALRRGGYLIVDEIETNLNKTLVQSVISLFNSPQTNPNGATLVFTTHYPELLDEISRKDNIYLLVRDEGYKTEVVKYSDRIKRIENKKSEVIFSNQIKGTAPRYYDMERMRQYVREAVGNAK